MNECEREYYDEIGKKKITASGSRHRKNGSRSKKCTLPSDHMTRKELAALNGEVKTYKLGEPMTQEEYEKLPDDLKPYAKLKPPADEEAAKDE